MSLGNSKSSNSNTAHNYDQRKTETINAGIGGSIDDSFVSSGNYGDTKITSDSSRRYYNQDYNQDYSREYDYSDNSDNSLNLDLEDNSDRSWTDNSRVDNSFTDNSDRSSSWADYSDNSVRTEVTDASDRSWTDNSDRSFTDQSDRSSNWEDSSDRSFTDQSDRSFTDNSDNSLRVDYSDTSDRSWTDNSDRRTDNSVTEITDGGAFALVEGANTTMAESYADSQARLFEFAGSVIDGAGNLAQQSLDGAMSIKAGQTITEPANQTMRELADAGIKIALIAGGAYAISKAL